MRREHDLYNKNVGESYMNLLQIRDGKIYTGDGVLVDLGVGPGNSNTVGNLPGSGAGGSTVDPPRITIQENIIEEIIISSPTEYLLMLSYSPISNKPISVMWNGLYLRKGLQNDYTVLDNTIEINEEHQLDDGDLFTITYWKLSYV